MWHVYNAVYVEKLHWESRLSVVHASSMWNTYMLLAGMS